MRRLACLALCILALMACACGDKRVNTPGFASPEWVANEILSDMHPADAYMLAEEAEDSPLCKPLSDIANRVYRISSGMLGQEILLVQSRDVVAFTDKDTVARLEDFARMRAQTYGMEYTVTSSAYYAALIFAKDRNVFRDLSASCYRVFIGQPRPTKP